MQGCRCGQPDDGPPVGPVNWTSAAQPFPPWITVSFRIIGGRSGRGRLAASRSVNRALHSGSSWFGDCSHGRSLLGQSRAILWSRSQSWMSAPYSAASRASRYCPFRCGHRGQSTRTITHGKSDSRSTIAAPCHYANKTRTCRGRFQPMSMRIVQETGPCLSYPLTSINGLGRCGPWGG